MVNELVLAKKINAIKTGYAVIASDEEMDRIEMDLIEAEVEIRSVKNPLAIGLLDKYTVWRADLGKSCIPLTVRILSLQEQCSFLKQGYSILASCADLLEFEAAGWEISSIKNPCRTGPLDEWQAWSWGHGLDTSSPPHLNPRQ
jgi:hypothetical protein